MKREGQIVLTPFPHTDLAKAKLRPVLLLRRASARYDDWLVCMVSSQIWQAETDMDEIISQDGEPLCSGQQVDNFIGNCAPCRIRYLICNRSCLGGFGTATLHC